MSDSQDKSDDLIAELAKLMASGAAGSESAPKPTVIKLPPLDDATIKAAPVRIPGMDAPASAAPKADRPAASSSGGAVRIPGMDRPAEVSDGMPSAPKPRAGTQFDFGKPAAAQASNAGPATPAEPAAPPRPAPRPAGPNPSIPPVTFGAASPPPARPPVSDAAPEDESDDSAVDAAPTGQQPEPPRQPVPQRQPPQPPQTHHAEPAEADDDDDDPIADLIAAELGVDQESDVSEDLPPPVVTPAPVQPRPQPAQPPATARPSPANVTPQQPATDRFNVSPPFGTSERPMSPPKPAASAPEPSVDSYDDDDSDPMDEIESLIGEAVRVELNPPERPATQEPAPAPAPAAPIVPPLNTSFGPRRSGLRETEPQVDSAEAAIMAAAADSDADFDAVDTPSDEDRPYKRMRVKPPRTSGIPGGVRQYVGIAVAGTLLLAAGFGLYWVLGMDRGDPAEAPVLTADASPTKVEPVTPVTTSEPASGSVVFDEIDGVADSADNEALVSRDETAGETPAEVARVVTPTADEGDETTVADTGLANRKVRTVTVRPDGTIVASDDTIAGTSELPVDRPNVPEIAGAEEQSDLLTAAVAGTRVATDTVDGADPLSALAADSSGDSDLLTPDPIDVAALNETTETPAVFDGSLQAPVPMPRPFAREAMVGGSQPVSLTTSTPAPSSSTSGANAPASTPLTALTSNQTSAPAPAASSGSRTYVQLSSQRSEGDANASMRAVQSQLGGLLSSSLEIRRVDLGAKGIWYRVVMPTSSFQDATQSCARIKANGGDCVAING